MKRLPTPAEQDLYLILFAIVLQCSSPLLDKALTVFIIDLVEMTIDIAF